MAILQGKLNSALVKVTELEGLLKDAKSVGGIICMDEIKALECKIEELNEHITR